MQQSRCSSACLAVGMFTERSQSAVMCRTKSLPFMRFEEAFTNIGTASGEKILLKFD